MYNLLEYSDNYVDSYGSLWKSKRDEQNMNNAGNPVNVTAADSSLFKYKSGFLETSDAVGDDVFKKVFRNVKIVVPLKYLSNFFRSLLEVPLINSKIHLVHSFIV